MNTESLFSFNIFDRFEDRCQGVSAIGSATVKVVNARKPMWRGTLGARATLLRLNSQLFLHHRVVELHRETSARIISIPLVFEMPRKELTRFTNCNVVQRTIPI